MRKKQERPVKLKRYSNYTNEALLNAYEAVHTGGSSVRRVAAEYNVPVQTLRDRVNGKVDGKKLQSGVETLLSDGEEELFIEHLETMCQLGYGYSSGQVKCLAGDMAYDLGRRKDRKPLSNNWMVGFMKRWGGRIASLKPKSLDTNRAKSANPESVQRYFTNLTEICDKYNLKDKPQYIYNIDETGIQPEHRPPNVIAPIGSKPQAVTSPRSTTTTVIGCASASGNSIPPFFIFKGKRYNSELMTGASPGARAVMSDSGWSNSEIFQKYLEEQFLPNVPRNIDDQKILLICDGHVSHVSKAAIEWAKTHNIIIFILPAHTSHLLQPLDVSIFSPFKSYYYHECASYMRENIGKTVTRYDMCNLACKAYTKSMTPTNIVSGFKNTGIYPIDDEIVPAEKLFPSEAFKDDTPVERVAALKSGKEAMEKYLMQKAERKCDCQCNCHQITANKKKQPSVIKPNPAGRAITEDQYIQSVKDHEERKDKQLQKPSSPKPSTSGLNADVISDSESEMDCRELCCVCNEATPPNIDDYPFSKVLSWACCDACGHWVHLRFCTKQSRAEKQHILLPTLPVI